MSQAHKILECMKTHPELFSLPFADVGLYDERLGLMTAKHFVFDFKAPEEMVIFGLEAFNAGLLRLPFPKVYYEANPYNNSKDTRMAVLALDELERPGDGGGCFLMMTYIRLDGVWGRLGAIMVRPRPGDGRKVDVRSNLTIDQGLMSGNEGANALKDLELAAPMVLGYTAALSSKSIVMHGEQAPERLNKKRALRGNPPLAAYSRITISLPKARVAAEPGEGCERSSPIMHWRRGHIRHWHDGRLIPIPPVIVNAADDAPLKREYRVRGTGGEL